VGACCGGHTRPVLAVEGVGSGGPLFGPGLGVEDHRCGRPGCERQRRRPTRWARHRAGMPSRPCWLPHRQRTPGCGHRAGLAGALEVALSKTVVAAAPHTSSALIRSGADIPRAPCSIFEIVLRVLPTAWPSSGCETTAAVRYAASRAPSWRRMVSSLARSTAMVAASASMCTPDRFLVSASGTTARR
jgi:hypothetical protein